MTVTEDSTQSLHQKKYNNDFTNLYRLHYLRRLQSIAEKRGNKAAEQHCAKKKKQKLRSNQRRERPKLR